MIMDYKKAYKDLMRDIDIAIEGQNDGETKVVLQNIKERNIESEDERIRKTLIHIVKGACDKYGIKYKGDEITEEKLLAYLERQKKQTTKTDACGFPIRDQGESACSYLVRCLAPDMRNIWYEACAEIKERQKEQKPVDYAEELKKCNDNPLYFYNKYVKVKQKPVEWSEEDEKKLSAVISLMKSSRAVDPFYDKMCLEGWLKSLPERFNLQPKQEWSEEDEIRLKEAIEVLDESIKYLPMGYGFSKDVSFVKDWLKSLRPQKKREWSEDDKGVLLSIKCVIDEIWHSKNNTTDCPNDELEEMWRWLNTLWERVEYPQSHWKPSEEQMEALKLIVSNKKHYAPVLHEIALDTLYNDLKSL